MYKVLTVAALASLLTACQTATQETATPEPAPEVQQAPAAATDPVTKIGSGYRIDAPILVALNAAQNCPKGVPTSLRAAGSSATNLYFKGKRPSREFEEAYIACVRRNLS